MGQYADRLSNLELLLQLQKSAGRDDLSATDVTALTSMVYVAADTVGPLLGRIPQTFAQYTEHDIGHSANIIYLAGKFIPAETLERLNGLELAMLLLAALLHDVGMYVEDKEKDEAIESREFLAFSATHERSAALGEARKAGQVRHAERIRDALLADYFRHLHPERAGQHIRKYLNGKLVFREIDISEHVIRLCASHAWGTLESNDPRRPEKTVAKLDTRQPFYGVTVNLQYLACCLRLADIMDFDRSRTPLAVFQTVDFTEGKSWEEWNKHLQVSGWVVNEHEVQFATDCTHPAFFVAVMDFLDWIDTELRDCRQLLVKEVPKAIADKYQFHLPPAVDRFKIAMADKQFIAGAFRFQLEYDRIMQLLMDKSLYPDPSLFLRELLQNSLDACRSREAVAKSMGASKLYKPRITIWDYSSDRLNPRIVFQDNGIGMSRRILESYFMRVGRSYYKSAEFDAERQRLHEKGVALEATSQFGIGILSCFMVADHLDVETYRKGSKPLQVKIEGATKYFLVKQLDEPEEPEFQVQPSSDAEDGPPNYPGTRITLHLKAGVVLDVHQVLDRFAVNIEYNISVYKPSRRKPLRIKAFRWEVADLSSASMPELLGRRQMLLSDWVSRAEAPIDPRPNTVEALRSILVASNIHFDRYEFSRHLRGSAWLWLIAGEDGQPVPSRGNLEISPDTFLRLTGLPDLIGRIQASVRDTAMVSDLLFYLKRSIEGGGVPFQDYLDESNSYEASLSGDASVLDEEWNDLSVDARAVVYDSLSAYDYRAKPWHANSVVINELLRGTYRWRDLPVKFYDSLAVNAVPQLMALHGILIPAGPIQWDPMTGTSRKVRIVTFPGGFQIDVRGPQTPMLAASRLFLPESEAGLVAVPLLRAYIRHATELTEEQSCADQWRRWLIGVIDSTTRTNFGKKAVLAERYHLETIVPGIADRALRHSKLAFRYEWL